MKANYHTHTTRCQHASGSDEEYVLKAIRAGFDTLGFSDHSPWKYDTAFVSGIRMPLVDYPQYKASILELKAKYADQINILFGVEAEYFHKYMDWFKQFIKEEQLDYVILGNHYFETDELHIYYGNVCDKDDYLEDYINTCIQGMKSGIYSYLAHPDLYLRARKWDKQCEKAAHKLCKAAKENNFILEFNLAGVRMQQQFNIQAYPHPKFWQIAGSYGCKAIVGVDAHDPNDLLCMHLFEESKKALATLGCEVIETIPLLKDLGVY